MVDGLAFLSTLQNTRDIVFWARKWFARCWWLVKESWGTVPEQKGWQRKLLRCVHKVHWDVCVLEWEKLQHWHCILKGLLLQYHCVCNMYCKKGAMWLANKTLWPRYGNQWAGTTNHIYLPISICSERKTFSLHTPGVQVCPNGSSSDHSYSSANL